MYFLFLARQFTVFRTNMATRFVLSITTAIVVVRGAALDCSSVATPHLDLYGARIESLTVSPVRNYSLYTPQNGASPSFCTLWTGLDFCNVTVAYTHPCRGDSVNIKIWLPLHNWDVPFQDVGGGGCVIGTEVGFAPAVGIGYAVAVSDGGHGSDSDAAADPSHWTMVSPGNVNLGLLRSFASTGLHDLAVVGKTVTESFYGTAPKY